jgi:hypothetical protein
MRWIVSMSVTRTAFIAASCLWAVCPFCAGACAAKGPGSADRFPSGKTVHSDEKSCRMDCQLSPAGRAERHKLFVTSLRPRIRTVRELPNGYALGFPSDDSIIMDLAAWIRDERKCCSFLDYQLRVERNSPLVWFEASGTPNAKKKLAEMLTNGGVKLKK